MHSLKIPLFIFILFVFQNISAQHKIYLLNGKMKEGKIIAKDVKYLGYEVKGKLKKIPSGMVDYYIADNKTVKPYDQINFMNGRTLNAEVTKRDSQYIYYQELGTPRRAFKERVFSIIQDEKEEVLFETFYGPNDTVTPMQARSYVLGRQDARRHYNKAWPAIVNTAVGFAGGYFLVYYGVLAPATFAAVDGVINVRATKRHMKLFGNKFKDDLHYRAGFNKQAKRIKMRNDMIGGISGLGAGIATFLIINNNK